MRRLVRNMDTPRWRAFWQSVTAPSQADRLEAELREARATIRMREAELAWLWNEIREMRQRKDEK